MLGPRVLTRSETGDVRLSFCRCLPETDYHFLWCSRRLHHCVGNWEVRRQHWEAILELNLCTAEYTVLVVSHPHSSVNEGHTVNYYCWSDAMQSYVRLLCDHHIYSPIQYNLFSSLPPKTNPKLTTVATANMPQSTLGPHRS